MRIKSLLYPFWVFSSYTYSATSALGINQALDDIELRASQVNDHINHDLKCFAYFNNIDETYNWTEASADPLHRANTPLLRRPGIPDSLRMNASSDILIMHDYKGGYIENGYEACQGAQVTSKDYILEYWQHLSIFNYFTHHQIGIPPPTWINTGHRNGVMVLGTFIIENSEQTWRMMEKLADGRYKLVDILIRMALHYGFDGWFMNIERGIDVEEDIWNGGKLLELFLQQLQSGLKVLPSGGKVIW